MEETRLTGYPSIDKPWLKYYSEEAINAPLPECTIYDVLYANNSENQNDTALTYFGRKFTYKELFEDIEQAAKAFVKIGVKQGDVVALCSITTPEAIVALYSLNRIGAIVYLVDIRKSCLEIEEGILKADVKVFVTLDILFEKYSDLKEKGIIKTVVAFPIYRSMSLINKLPVLLFNKNRIKSKYMCWDTFIKSGKNICIPHIECDSRSTAVLVQTGGTTGTPKQVMLSNLCINSIACQYKTIFKYYRGQTFLNVMPPFIAYGITTNLHMPLVLGLNQIIIPKVTVEKFGILLLKHKPNYVISIPAHWRSLLESSKIKANTNLSFLTVAGSGGDGMTEELEKRCNQFFLEHASNTKILKGYGMTEVGASAVTNTKESNELSSVGIPLPLNSIKIINCENGRELGYEQAGEILITGPSLMNGYFNSDENVFEIDTNGTKWIHTMDIGKISKTGSLYILGRMKRVIIVDGHNVFPSSIENCIASVEGVTNCAVIGYIDNGKCQVFAFVVGEAGIEHRILKKCQLNLDETAVPTKCVFVNSIPLTPIGKVDYRALEELAKNIGK